MSVSILSLGYASIWIILVMIQCAIGKIIPAVAIVIMNTIIIVKVNFCVPNIHKHIACLFVCKLKNKLLETVFSIWKCLYFLIIFFLAQKNLAKKATFEWSNEIKRTIPDQRDQSTWIERRCSKRSRYFFESSIPDISGYSSRR